MHQQLPGTPVLVRAVNRQRVLEQVRRTGEISRAELAKVTSIRPPTISAVIRQLIAEGVVEEIGAAEPTTGLGRPPRVVTLARHRPRALGFEIGARMVRGALLDISGAIGRSVRVEHGAGTPDDVAGRLLEIGNSLLAAEHTAWSELKGVGVALPGLVDPIRGVVRWSRPLNWTGVPFRELCEARWETPTDVVNNAVAGSLAVHFLGPARDIHNLIYLYMRFRVVEPGVADEAHPIVRVGSGIIVHDEPYYGDFGAAGELSQPVQHPLSYARDEAGRPYADIGAFVEAVQRDDAGARSALERLVQDIGLVVRLAVGILDPGMIVIDSDEPVLRDRLLPRLDQLLNEDYLRKEAGTTRVVASTLGEYGMVCGAVVPTLQRVFRLPRWS